MSRWVRGYRSISNGASSSPPKGDAGGDLDGKYPDPNVIAIHESGGPTKLQIGIFADGQVGKRVGETFVGTTLPNLAPANKSMIASVTTMDGDLATAFALSNTLAPNAWLLVLVNGISCKVGNGTKVGVSCYFSSNGGDTPKTIGNLTAGDYLYWNGSVAGFELDANDRIDFVYEV